MSGDRLILGVLIMIKFFDKNEKGRDIAVGDIHGQFSKLQSSLDSIGFNPQVDRLFSVGDLIDRGEESDLVVDWLKKPWFHAVRGNHDDFAIRHVRIGKIDQQNYIRNGGAWFLGLPSREQEEIVSHLELLPFAMQIDTGRGIVGIVHADCPFDSWIELVGSLQEKDQSKNKMKQVTDWLMWARDRIESGFDGGVSGVRALVVGHNPVHEPVTLGNVMFIDTMGWRLTGEFTLLDMETLQVLNAK